MIEYDNKNWLNLLFTLRGSVIPSIATRIMLFTIFSAVITGLHRWGIVNLSSMPSTPWTMVGVALGLLLVFRTNTAYDRYWEGRRLWGDITNATRHLGIGINAWVTNHRDTPLLQQRLFGLLQFFPVALKQHLRKINDPINNIEGLTPADHNKISTAAHRPLAVLSQLMLIIQEIAARGFLTEERILMLNSNLNDLTRSLGGCERIRNTPLPIAYVLHIKRFLSLFCLTIGLPLAGTMGWWTVLATALVSYAFIGIEEIGVEIEDPFGEDPNDLPLDTICATIARNLRDLKPIE